MKRIYVCCILLILLGSLAVFYGAFTGGGVEGFQTLGAPPASIKCTKTVSNTHTYWFCDNKNMTDALIAGKFAAPADSVCIQRGASQSREFTCLERDKLRTDRRFVLNRQKRNICDMLNKNFKDINKNIDKGVDLTTIAANTMSTIQRTEPDIGILKKNNPRLTAFLNEKDAYVERQKGILNDFMNEIADPINNSRVSRDNLNAVSEKLGC